MVAKIESGKSLTGAFYYNENKVSASKAQLLGTSGYVKSDSLLTLQDKLFRLTDLAGKNIRTKTNTVHLSLNFDIQENIDDNKLLDIAGDYMKRIGFEDQPYLIYKHTDAGHPHIHVLTTNIQSDGTRISLNNIGKLRSEPARKAIEIQFGLIKAEEQKRQKEAAIDPDLKPVVYGASDTKRAITNIVTHVNRSYKFTSLPEFNAILNLYNVTAHQGTKESTMYKNGGLQYWVTDANGLRIGVPIKASSIYQKPTLKLLQERFKLNGYLRKPFKEALKNRIDQSLKRSASIAEFKNHLQKVQVDVVVRQNAEGRIYGLSYIDLAGKVIFNGSDLGKTYSAGPVVSALQLNQTTGTSSTLARSSEKTGGLITNENQVSAHASGNSLLDDLLNPSDVNNMVQEQFGPRKKKKKRRKLNH